MTNDEAVLDSTPALASMFRLQWEEVQQSWVLLYPEGMVKLNGSAGEIIKRLDGKKTVTALIAELESEVEGFLAELDAKVAQLRALYSQREAA